MLLLHPNAIPPFPQLNQPFETKGGGRRPNPKNGPQGAGPAQRKELVLVPDPAAVRFPPVPIPRVVSLVAILSVLIPHLSSLLLLHCVNCVCPYALGYGPVLILIRSCPRKKSVPLRFLGCTCMYPVLRPPHPSLTSCCVVLRCTLFPPVSHPSDPL